LAAALFLFGFAFESFALTIGRPQGAVWIGKPLDVVIPLSLDDAEAGGALCLEAEVTQGDVPMPSGSVRVTLEPGAGPAHSRMRIRSRATVDEPVVNVSVRAGCEMRSTRSYVLLADVPAQSSLPVVSRSEAPAPVRQGAASSRTAATGFPSGSGGEATARRQAAAAAPLAAVQEGESQPARRAAVQSQRRAAAAASQAPAAARAASPRSPTAQAAAEPPRPEARAGGPRLQLESLAPAPVAQAGLKTTTQLALPPAEDPARRAAAAAQWRALSAGPEAAQRESERIKGLEATLAALREQTAQNQRALLELRTELAQARESRYSNPLVYALVGLLLLALIAILMLWRLAARRTEPAWWRESPAKGDEGPTRPDTWSEMADEELAGKSGRRRSANATNFGTTTFAGLVPEEDDEDIEPPSTRTPDGMPVRPVNTEELFDVQQQSDFFLSLGQHEQAIAVLREHIASNPGTSALAYLDLLRIYHSLDRREDYARLAEEFERAFNADVPAFDRFNQTGKGLEHYRSTLARIESQWPAPGTLALIEELIFRKPGTQEEAFDLAAYQELLLLYSVAKEVIDPDMAVAPPVTPPSFADTFGHEQMATAPAPIEPESPPEAIEAGPTLPPSLYAEIDDELGHQTVMSPEVPASAPEVPARDSVRVQPEVSLDLQDFDRTAFETMRAPIETPRPPPAPSMDPHVIDFELFDPETEAEIAPKPVKRR
jgi:hypothetical protein